MTEIGNFVSQGKECVPELSGVRREVSKRAHQVNLHTHGENSRRLSSLKRKTVWGEAQSRFTEQSGILYQEGIELV
jgi:hypothetical protein